jgi:hypothetical protein
LFLANNQITDITPLAGLRNLVEVDLVNNPVTDWTPLNHVQYVWGRPQEDVLNAFLCGVDLDWIRNGGTYSRGGQLRQWPGLGVDFTLGNYIVTYVDQGWTHSHRMLNLTVPHSLNLNTISNIQWNDTRLGTQTGDVVLLRVVTHLGDVWWAVMVDVGPSLEAIPARGFEVTNPAITANHRAYIRIEGPVLDCTC